MPASGVRLPVPCFNAFCVPGKPPLHEQQLPFFSPGGVNSPHGRSLANLPWTSSETRQFYR
jgi:hypothetical protein